MKVAPLCLLICLLLAIPATAQVLPVNQRDAAAIKSQLKYEPNDSVRVNLVQQLGVLQLLKPGYVKLNIDSALRYFLHALKLCDSLKLRPNNRYEAMLRVGEAYFLLKDFVKGKQYFMQVIRVYQQAADKKREARTWLRLAIKIKLGNPYRHDIIPILVNAKKLYYQLGDKDKEAQVLLEKGIVYQLQFQLDSAESNLLASVKLYQTTRLPELSRVFYYLATIYRTKGDMSKALSYTLQTIEDTKKRGDTLKLGPQVSYYGDLGYIYSALNNTTSAQNNFRKAIRLSTKNSVNHITLDVTYEHITALMRESIKIGQVEPGMKEAQQLFKAFPPSDSLQLGQHAETWGLYYQERKQWDKAESAFRKMLAYYHFRDVNESWGNKVLATFYLSQKKFTQANTYLQKEFKYVSSLSRTYLNDAEDEQFYYKIDSANGNFISALEHFRKFKQKSDSVFNSTKNKEIAEIETRYETRKKEVAITALKKDGILLRRQVSQASYIQNLSIVGVVMLLFIVVLLITGYRRKQQTNLLLNNLLHDKDNLLEEKQWLLKEIHHRVKNNLQIVMGLLQRQSAYINNAEALAAIQNSENRMHSVALIHQKLYQSEDLNLICMPEYINELIGHLIDTAETGNRIQFSKEVDDIYLDVSQAVPLGLILNEAITNSIKYAYPAESYGKIKVALIANGDLVTLTVADEGVGLPANFVLEQATSLGLNLIKGLSKQLSGKLSFQNKGGMSIMLTFKPIASDPAQVDSLHIVAG